MYEARATASRTPRSADRGVPVAESRRGGTTKEPGQKPAAPDSSPADAQGADYNNDEGHAALHWFLGGGCK